MNRISIFFRSWSSLAALRGREHNRAHRNSILPSIYHRHLATQSTFDPELVNQLKLSNPLLQNHSPEVFQQSMQLFRDQGFTTDSYLRIISKLPRILTTPAAILCSNLELWRASQFGERYVQILVTEHPHLLDMRVENQHAEQKILERLMYLKDYVQTKKNVWRLLVSSPNVVVDKISDVEEKRTYFEEVMKVEHTEVVKTMAFSHPMAEIRLRHEFLVRLGMYKPKNPKADPTLKSSNPSLYQILDTNEKRFATRVAQVSLDEYEVFKEVFKREQDRKAGVREWSNEDQEDSDDEADVEIVGEKSHV